MSKEEQLITIKNFRKVNDWFYRGGQPLENEFEQLIDLGVKTIICLRWSKGVIQKETSVVEKRNLNFVSIPLNYWRLPNEDEINRYFSIIDEEKNRPVFLHCKHGSDRTGMLTSFYRMKYDNWTADQAYAEMKEAGFHKIRMHHFKFAVYRFARKLN